MISLQKIAQLQYLGGLKYIIDGIHDVFFLICTSLISLSISAKREKHLEFSTWVSNVSIPEWLLSNYLEYLLLMMAFGPSLGLFCLLRQIHLIIPSSFQPNSAKKLPKTPFIHSFILCFTENGQLAQCKEPRKLHTHKR